MYYESSSTNSELTRHPIKHSDGRQRSLNAQTEIAMVIKTTNNY